MGKRVVVALGGNALGNNLTEQMTAVKQTSKAIADLIEAGYEVILSHGNGPQVGMIQLAMEEFSFNNPQYPVVPLSMCVAMSQSYIGYDLENALQEELRQRNISKAVTTIVTQVVVDENDPAFKTNETNWPLHDKRRSRTISQRKNIQVMEDAGRGYRQVVASPKPKILSNFSRFKHWLMLAKQSLLAAVVASQSFKKGTD